MKKYCYLLVAIVSFLNPLTGGANNVYDRHVKNDISEVSPGVSSIVNN